MSTKTCSSCLIEQPVSEFYRHKNYPDGYRSSCKTCSKEYERLRYLKHKILGTKYYKNKPSSVRRQNYKSNFGITIEQYDELLEKQDHKCAVCHTHEDDLSKRLAIDHDDVTNEIRGLLCNKCNLHLISDHRESTIFKNAITYLERTFTGWFIPDKGNK